jgi:outer membrane protein assembly factor BamB
MYGMGAILVVAQPGKYNRSGMIDLLACFLLLLPAAEARETIRDWPEFRGPTGQGQAGNQNLPVHWSATKNVAWKQAIPGRGWSSPIVSAGRIYLTTSVPAGDSASGDQSLEALCLDAESGKILWQREVIHQDRATAPAVHSKNSHASPTPLVHEGRLYVHFGHQGTACLDLAGNVLWRNTEIKYQPVHGNGGSPILVHDLLVFSCDGADGRFLVALDCQTGKVRWRVDRAGDVDRKFSFSTPLLITVNGQEQIISPGSDSVSAFRPRDGHEIWRVRYEGYSVVPRPVYGHGLVFLSTGFNSPSLMAIRPTGRGDVTDSHVAWTVRRSMPLTPSPLLVGAELYTLSDNGVASCLDAGTGRVHWQQRIGGNYSASPITASGRIYFQSEEGTGVVIRAGNRFELLAKNTLGERTLASYAVAEGALFIRTEEHLYRIRETGRD